MSQVSFIFGHIPGTAVYENKHYLGYILIVQSSGELFSDGSAATRWATESEVQSSKDPQGQTENTGSTSPYYRLPHSEVESWGRNTQLGTSFIPLKRKEGSNRLFACVWQLFATFYSGRFRQKSFLVTWLIYNFILKLKLYFLNTQ